MRGKNYPVVNKLLISSLAVLAVFLVLPSWVLAAEVPVESEAKLRVKNVAIRGAKVRLPIPDGYEEMRREDKPATYDWLVEMHSDIDALPLAFFINSKDKSSLKEGGVNVGLRYGVALSDRKYWDDVIEDNFLDNFKMRMTKYFESVSKRVDEEIKVKDAIPLVRSVLYDGKRSVSFFYAMRENFFNRKYRTIHSVSYIVVDKKIVEYAFWRFAYNNFAVQELKQDLLQFLEKIDNNNY